MRKSALTLLAFGIFIGLAGSDALAGGREPGSLLIFPVYNSEPGMETLITVTNTHPSMGTWIEYRYIDGQSCLKSDRTEFLTANDTLTVVASAHIFNQAKGYVYVYAKETINSGSPPIVHNWLVGQASLIDGIEILEASYNALAMVGIGDGTYTDIDADEELDLDGVEYEKTPDFTIQPRFIGQADEQNPGFDSRLAIINLTGGREFTAEIRFTVYNDNEVPSSATYGFDCWIYKRLLRISGAFSATNLKYQDDDEEIIGVPDLEAGWFTLDGIVANSNCDSVDDPALLHLLIETTGRAFAGGDLPFESVDKQDNGDLLQRSCFGE